MISLLATAIAESLCEDSAQFPVDFNYAWQWLGYDSKEGAKTSFLEMGFVVELDFIIDRTESTFENPFPPQQIGMTVECLKTWALMVGSEQSCLIRKTLMECEKMDTTNRPKLELTPRQTADLAILVIWQVGAIVNLSSEMVGQLALQAAVIVHPELAASLEPMHQAIDNLAINGDLLTVAQLGSQIGLSECKAIELLLEKGLERIVSLNLSGKLEHLQTPLGEQYSEFVGSLADGTRELRWKESVIDLLCSRGRN